MITIFPYLFSKRVGKQKIGTYAYMLLTKHFLKQEGDKIDKVFLEQKQTSWGGFRQCRVGIGVAQTKRRYRPSLPKNTPACTFKTWSNRPEPGYKDVTALELFKTRFFIRSTLGWHAWSKSRIWCVFHDRYTQKP